MSSTLLIIIQHFKGMFNYVLFPILKLQKSPLLSGLIKEKLT